MNPNYPPKDYHALDLNQLQRISLKNRENLVSYQQFAKLPLPGASFKEFIQSLPPILAGIEFFKLVDWMFNALQQQQPIGLAMGAHVLKCGLSPLIQDLLERKIFAIVALHGAGAIHDLEFSLIGESSEDVKKELDRGQFGMAQETAFHFAQALKLTQEKQIGLGRALGLIALKQPYAHLSVLATAARLQIPLTVHVALGTDIIHMHPEIRGDLLGESSLHDFRIVCQAMMDFENGVWINLGSAVILPEVFLKAVSVARNLGRTFQGLKTANLDMLRHYRSSQNVVSRPSSQGLHITGHHEILVPLLRLALLEKLAESDTKASH